MVRRTGSRGSLRGSRTRLRIKAAKPRRAAYGRASRRGPPPPRPEGFAGLLLPALPPPPAAESQRRGQGHTPAGGVPPCPWRRRRHPTVTQEEGGDGRCVLSRGRVPAAGSKGPVTSSASGGSRRPIFVRTGTIRRVLPRGVPSRAAAPPLSNQVPRRVHQGVTGDIQRGRDRAALRLRIWPVTRRCWRWPPCRTWRLR